MQHPAVLSIVAGEALDGAAFTAQEFAHACGVAPAWLQARVEAGVLQVDTGSGAWRFDSVTLLRARRLLQLEVTYDADPQLAALTADLIEEVTRLRRQLASRST